MLSIVIPNDFWSDNFTEATNTKNIIKNIIWLSENYEKTKKFKFFDFTLVSDDAIISETCEQVYYNYLRSNESSFMGFPWKEQVL